MVRYNYSFHSSRQRAENSIEDSLASGEISLSESPAVVRLSDKCYAVQLIDHNATK